MSIPNSLIRGCLSQLRNFGSKKTLVSIQTPTLFTQIPTPFSQDFPKFVQRPISTVRPISLHLHLLSLTAFYIAYDDGRSQLLLCLHGTLPITYRQATYNIPVAIWVTRDYPREHPIAYVVAAPDMLIRASQSIDLSGRCNIEYIQNWKRKSEVRGFRSPEPTLIPVDSRVAVLFALQRPCRTTSLKSLRSMPNQRKPQILPLLRHRSPTIPQNHHLHFPVHNPNHFSSLNPRQTRLSRPPHHHHIPLRNL